MAEQLDAPFLGGKSTSGTARAKVLGKLAGKWILPESYLVQIYTGGEGIKNLTKKAIIENKAKLQGYEYLPDIIVKYNNSLLVIFINSFHLKH